jgi:hypothetical protein
MKCGGVDLRPEAWVQALVVRCARDGQVVFAVIGPPRRYVELVTADLSVDAAAEPRDALAPGCFCAVLGVEVPDASGAVVLVALLFS